MTLCPKCKGLEIYLMPVWRWHIWMPCDLCYEGKLIKPINREIEMKLTCDKCQGRGKTYSLADTAADGTFCSYCSGTGQAEYEPNKQYYLGAFKLMEEMGELTQVLAKLCAFPVGKHPDENPPSGRARPPIRERLIEECVDVKAALQYFLVTNGLYSSEIVQRYEKKLGKFREYVLTGPQEVPKDVGYNKVGQEAGKYVYTWEGKIFGHCTNEDLINCIKSNSGNDSDFKKAAQAELVKRANALIDFAEKGRK